MKQKNLDIIKEKGSGFKVPKGYFKTVEDAVLSELITDNFHKKIRIYRTGRILRID